MTRFVDVYLPEKIPGYLCSSEPRFSTSLASAASGDEQANRNWEHPLYRYLLPEAVREWGVVQALRDHWLVMGGPAQTWPFRDPTDFASVPLPMVPMQSPPPISAVDQVVATGDGFKRSFQLVKAYTRPGATAYVRPIQLPIVQTVLISVGGADVSMSNPWTVTREGGVITFTTAPANGAVIRAGFLFDVLVRFEADDSFATILRDYNAGGFADLTLLGMRMC